MAKNSKLLMQKKRALRRRRRRRRYRKVSENRVEPSNK